MQGHGFSWNSGAFFDDLRAGGGDDCVHEARRCIDADVGVHPDMPVIATLQLVHLQMALAEFLFCRWWRDDQRRVDDGPLAHRQAPFRLSGR